MRTGIERQVDHGNCAEMLVTGPDSKVRRMTCRELVVH